MTASLWISGTILLVLANGFFVAAEFALVKLRPSQLTGLLRERRAGAKSAAWLMKRLDNALSACQLGITVASLGLGWIGEPAIARLLEPVLHSVGIKSSAVLHGVSFAIGFAIITSAHLVIGEQAPKIFAIRKPDKMALWCAVPLRIFYTLSLPFLKALSWATAVILRRVGIVGAGEHDPHSEEEIRTLLSQAHAHGELTRSEHRLLNAVFEFDDTVCRQIMLPRTKVEFFEISQSRDEMFDLIRRSMHTRYPICEGSLDNVLGFIHVKDFFRSEIRDHAQLRHHIRPPKYFPETMPISRLLSHFRASKHHLAFVVDEHGTVIGIVTMENVLERIVGEVQDEFDHEMPLVVPEGSGRFLIDGSANLTDVNRAMKVELSSSEVDTIAGLIAESAGRVVAVGDRIELDNVTAEVVSVKNSRASQLRLTVRQDTEESLQSD